MRDPNIPEKYTRERSAARKLAQEYFERFPKTGIRPRLRVGDTCSPCECRFTMKRLREPIEAAGVTHSSYCLTG